MQDDAGDLTTVRDAMLRRRLESASRMIDKFCGREFFVTTATRYIDSPVKGSFIPVRDLLSISSMTEDIDGDYDYTDQTWVEGTDFLLTPHNEFPKTAIEPTVLTGKLFYGVRKGLKIVGDFGYGDGESATPTRSTGATLAEDVNASVTSFDVSDGTLIQIGQTLLIGSERMYVEAIATDTVTVIRGVNGSTAATHASGDVISRYLFPSDVEEACISIAMRLLNRGPEHGRQSRSLGDESDTMEKVNPGTGLTNTEQGMLSAYCLRLGV